MPKKKRLRKYVMCSGLKDFNLAPSLAQTKEKLCKVIPSYDNKGE